ncbi:uncharacterized protein [Antedon mediterranea]|uniref:uncharacterized protein n=1 Tax=Antedon mediterranea TaxID=105859 RepID=UPI003AF9CD8A
MLHCLDNSKQTNSEGGVLWSRSDVLSGPRERILFRKQQLKHRSAHSSKQNEVDIGERSSYRQLHSARKSLPLVDSESILDIPKRSHSAPYTNRDTYVDIWELVGLGQTMLAFDNTEKLLNRHSKRRSKIMGQTKQSSEAQEVIYELRPDSTVSNTNYLQDHNLQQIDEDRIEAIQCDRKHNQNDDNTSLQCKFDINTALEKTIVEDCTPQGYNDRPNSDQMEKVNVQEQNGIKTKRRKKQRKYDVKLRNNHTNNGKRTRNSSRISTKKASQHRAPRIDIHTHKCPQTKITEENEFIGNKFKKNPADKEISALPFVKPERLVREKSFQLTYPGYDVRFKEPILTREPTITAIDKQTQKEIRDSSVEKCRMWLKGWEIN